MKYLHKNRILASFLPFTLLVFSMSVFAAEQTTQAGSDDFKTQFLRGYRAYISEYSLSGSTVVEESELAAIVELYMNKELGYDEISELRDKLTTVYISKGYVSSGVVIDYSKLGQNLLSIQVIEGVLSDVEVTNNGRLRASYLSRRVSPVQDSVVNIYDLEEKLQILRQNSRIVDIKSSLQPGAIAGHSVLSISVQEANPFRSFLEFSNHESPNIGSLRTLLGAEHDNLTGWGDRLITNFRHSEGLNAWQLRYSFPVSASDALVFVNVQQSDSEIVEGAFSELDINSSTSSLEVGTDIPIYQTKISRLGASFSLAKKRSESFLLGERFSFSEGVEDGIAELSVVNLGVLWSQRSRQDAVSISSTISSGIDALDATVSSEGESDGIFTKLLAQIQWTRRLAIFDSQVVVRGDLQVSDTALLGLEKMSIGGHDSVPSFRENSFTGDEGALISIGWNVPLRNSIGPLMRPVLSSSLTAGTVRNKETNSASQSLSSAGLGFRFHIARRLQVNIQWAQRFNGIAEEGELQDRGIHAAVKVEF